MSSSREARLPQPQSFNTTSQDRSQLRRSNRLVLQYNRNSRNHHSNKSISPALTSAPLFPLNRAPYRASAYTASVYSDRAFDDLYDVSDDDADGEEVPLKISASFKQFLSRNDVRRESLPSLIIPSPTAWPTIEKLQSANAAAAAAAAAATTAAPKSSAILLPIGKTPLSPSALAKVTTASSARLRVPTVHSTPSLDGSLASDEVASISPSTPDMRLLAREDGWDMPMQLNAQAMETLQHLSPDFTQELGPIIEVPEAQMGEMQEKGLNIALAPPLAEGAGPPLPEPDLVSAISLPSPGGFLASLPSAVREAWALPTSRPHPELVPPSTATAETFYGVPWQQQQQQQQHQRQRSEQRVVERIVESLGEDDETEGPPTARQNDFMSPTATNEMIIRPREYEYDEEYEKKLYETAASNKMRTSLWLSAQETYLLALKGASPRIPSDETLSPSSSPDLSAKSPTPEADTSPAKKAVRFAKDSPKDDPSQPRNLSTKLDPLFYHAFQHLTHSSRPADALDLAKIRSDALQAQRLYIADAHRAQLRGRYRLAAPKKPGKDYAHLPSAPNDPSVQRQRAAIAQADRERQALSQISLAHWHLEASRMLAGGSLVPRSVRDCVVRARAAGRTPRVLDLGGIATADWGWALALEERDAKVYTAVVPAPHVEPDGDDAASCRQHRGPSNHRVVHVPHAWSLPFADGSFDVVSARSLHALCRTRRPSVSNTLTSPHGDFDFPFAADAPSRPDSREEDEYTATLSEIRRVLAPNGAFHYHLLDAELGPAASSSPATPHAPVPALQTRSVAFAVSLRAQGLDPCAGHRSARRLAAAGFDRAAVRETWVELPVGRAGAGPGAADVAELTGAVAWERWVLDARGPAALAGVGSALDAARREGAAGLAWRMMVGVARR